MPLTVLDCQGISTTLGERIEAAVEAAGHRLAQPYEAWIAADPSRGGVRVLITRPLGFERTVAFAAMKHPSVFCRRMAAAQRKRWAVARKVKAAAAATPAPAKPARKNVR